ncbi:MAG TPA: hypothetical protein VK116_06830, partial [Planctomycetota bacterium]|nr:hypothetical protein [Planctomycetota bacterium]
LGADLVAGHRFDWEVWGRPGAVHGREGKDYHHFTAYGVLATPVPFVASERHRLIASAYAGVGRDVDRFSAPRVGGGPQGEEFFAISRPIIPGAAIEEFFPEHYAVLVFDYRYEPIFFTYLGPRVSVSFLERDRRTSVGIVSEDDVLASIGARLTTGFIGDLRIQIDYNYNFGVIRQGDFGGHDVVLQVSGSF